MDDRAIEAMHKLVEGNAEYMAAARNPADISLGKREETARLGQKPFAVVVTCADSRVAPEHIFSAGIGELFVVRTAGNVISDFDIGSVEYAVRTFETPLLAVMGHSRCGAVAAALSGGAEGYVGRVITEVKSGIGDAMTEHAATYNNVLHSGRRLLQSDVINGLRTSEKLHVICSIYDIVTGYVDFFDLK